jgi:GR25 family glycosyltransferase involved in LPS biosynthesis
MTTSKKKAAKKIAARVTGAKKTAKKAKKKTTAAQQLSPVKARALIQETRQELRRLKDDMMDPVFIAKVRRQNDPELENRLGNVLFELIDLHEMLSNAVLDSILQELRENEKALRTGISQVNVARQNLSKIKKVFRAADKFLAAVTSVVKAIV